MEKAAEGVGDAINPQFLVTDACLYKNWFKGEKNMYKEKLKEWWERCKKKDSTQERSKFKS